MTASEFAIDGILLQALQNPKDRLFIIGSEKTCEALFHPSIKVGKAQFPPMNSYFRMLMHRIARYYGLSHLADSKSGIVTLTVGSESRMPLIKLSELVEREDLMGSKPRGPLKVLKRTEQVAEVVTDAPTTIAEKSFEEKEREYNAFKQDILNGKQPEKTAELKPEVSTHLAADPVSQPMLEENRGIGFDDPSQKDKLRVHYIESNNEVSLPKHILQLKFTPPKAFDPLVVRMTAANRLNAELRFDSTQILLLFQSTKAAENAMKQDIFGVGVVLEQWAPKFFTTSMF